MIAVYYPGLLLLSAFFLAVHPITDSDYWYHLAFGRAVSETGSLPRTDLLSHTAEGRPWISSGWLPAVVLDGLNRAFGPAGPVGLVFGVVASALLLTYAVAVRRYGGSGGGAVLLILPGLLAAYPRLQPRPDLFSQFMIVPLLLLLLSTEDAARRRPAAPQRRLWFLPLLIVLWANLHALFVVGLAVIGIYGAWRMGLFLRTRDRTHRAALLPGALGLGVWLLNPYGTGYLDFIRDNASLPGIRRWVFELKPLLTAESLRGEIPRHHLAAICVLQTASGAILLHNRREIPLWRWAVGALLTGMAFWQRRHVGLLGAALPVLLLPHLASLDGWFARRSRRLALPVLAGAAALLICAGRVAGFFQLAPGLPRAGVDCAWFPCGAAEFLRRHPPPARLFNDLYTGGFLAWHLGPVGTKVFIDGRNEVYKGAPWNDFFGPPEGRSTYEELFAKYGIRTAVLDSRAAFDVPGHAANLLSASPDWVLVYFDDSYAVFVRDGGEGGDYVREHGLRYANPFNLRHLAEAVASPRTRPEALAEVERALKLSGESARAHLVAFAAALQTGDRARADRHLAMARRLDPTLAVGMSDGAPLE